MDNFKIIQTLGSGTFSKVIKVHRISDSREYAMKQVQFGALSKKEK